MSFRKGKIKDIFLSRTEVENIFISEYLPISPGDYVKIYLYGLFCADNNVNITHREMAKQLNVGEETLAEAWNHWEAMGAVKKIYNGAVERINYDIEYIDLRELMYGNELPGRKDSAETEGEPGEVFQDEGGAAASRAGEADADPISADRAKSRDDLREIFDYIEFIMGITLSGKDIKSISGWRDDFHVSEDVIKYLFEYCAEKGALNVNYAEKVLMSWVKDGLLTKEAIQEHLEKYSERNGRYKRVLKSLGLANRSATEAEKKKMDTWFDEMNFTLETVLEACDTTMSKSNPSIQYVNKVLENWHRESKDKGQDVNCKIKVTNSDINRFFKQLKEKKEEEAEERRREVYQAIPEIEEIDINIKDLGAEIASGILMHESESAQAEKRRLLSLFQQEKAVLLTENNYPADYMNIKYSCEICKDTGIDGNGGQCRCVSNRIGEIELWKNGNL